MYWNSFPLFLSKVPPLDVDSLWFELICCDSQQLSLLLLGPSTAVTSAVFCHQFAQAVIVKCKSLLICTALAFWLPLLGLIRTPRVVFSHSYSQEMPFGLMKFVREQLCSATSNLTEGWKENHRPSRKWSWGLARKWQAQYFCVSPASSSLSSFHKWHMSDPLQPLCPTFSVAKFIRCTLAPYFIYLNELVYG